MEVPTVPLGQAIVLLQDPLFDAERPVRVVGIWVRVIVGVVVRMAMLVRMLVRMLMIMVMGVAMIV